MNDKKSLLGLVLAGLVLFGYMMYQTERRKEMLPELEKQQAIEAQIQQEADKAAEKEAMAKQKAAMEAEADTTNALHMALQKNEGKAVIENELLRVTINNKGGQVSRVELKDPTYKNQQGGQVVLFDEQDSEMALQIDGKTQNINTGELWFSSAGCRVQGADLSSAVTMSLPVGEGSIDINYELVPNSYILKMDVVANGVEGFFPSDTKTMRIVWNEHMKQQEKGFDFENRYSTITYRTTDDDTDELSSAGADKEEDAEDLDGEKLRWMAFKTQFFAQILMAGDGNAFTPTLMTSKMEKKEAKNGYLKTLGAEMKTNFDPTGKQPTELKMYLGPSKFSTLRENEDLLQSEDDLDLQSIVYLGWPLIKYINRFFMLYLFDWMTSWGINMGIVLTLLTLIIKFAVYPLMRKSYLSSARMRVLKPKIDEIAKRYPNKEDAMVKQQETMKVYSEYGVSPMGGCLPMLIQMPIWIALFNFIPNAIELRGQSFLWSNDLSSYDDLISWGTHIWGIGDHLSLFCVLWCVSTVMSTLITMKQQQDSAMSEEQAQTMKMMKWMYYIMPLIFFFSFNGYSSGLNYYYFLSTILSVLMMWFMRKTTDDAKLLAQLERRHAERKQNNQGVRKTSSMMERMQEMARKQQELLEQQRAAQRKG